MSDSSNQRFPVVVVDDSPVARQLVDHALPPEHFNFIAAQTGHEALDLFASHRPGLVITDWLMPDLSGIELCRQLRSAFKDSFTYVILLTSVSQKSSVVEGLQAGADDYLTKPFDADELVARVNVGRRIVELHREIEAKNRFLQQLALTDELTGLPNRRAIEYWANRQLSGAKRHDFAFWVVLADLDEFKTINDVHGHEAGDVVLQTFAQILKANTRQCDMCGRIGGDEFLWVITYSNEQGVKLVVERLRHELATKKLCLRGQALTITVSFGVAGFRRGQQPDFQRLLAQADVALYSAKRLGRNRIALVPSEVP